MQTVTVQLFPIRNKADGERASQIEKNFNSRVTHYPIPVFFENRYNGKHGEVLKLFRDAKGLNARVLIENGLAWDFATGKVSNIKSAVVERYLDKKTGKPVGVTLTSIVLTESATSAFTFGERLPAYDIGTRSKNGEFFSNLGAKLGSDFASKR